MINTQSVANKIINWSDNLEHIREDTVRSLELINVGVPALTRSTVVNHISKITSCIGQNLNKMDQLVNYRSFLKNQLQSIENSLFTQSDYAGHNKWNVEKLLARNTAAFDLISTIEYIDNEYDILDKYNWELANIRKVIMSFIAKYEEV